jgi:hypothetical protein
MNASDLPQLGQFLGAWFHQDWTEEGHTSPMDVVRAYARDETPKVVRETIKEIEALLASRLAPAQMRRLVADDLGCAYDPTIDGKTIRAWLREVNGILHKAKV